MAGAFTAVVFSAFAGDFFVTAGFDAVSFAVPVFGLGFWAGSVFDVPAFESEAVDRAFLVVDFMASAPEAESNPKVNCSASALLADSLAGFLFFFFSVCLLVLPHYPNVALPMG